ADVFHQLRHDLVVPLAGYELLGAVGVDQAGVHRGGLFLRGKPDSTPHGSGFPDGATRCGPALARASWRWPWPVAGVETGHAGARMARWKGNPTTQGEHHDSPEVRTRTGAVVIAHGRQRLRQ